MTQHAPHHPETWPVIVVGAGPAGLVAAVTLARAGIRCLVVNRRTEVLEHPRATVISLRSMELLRSWGLEERIWAGGHLVEWQMRVSRTLVDAAAGESVDVGYPSIGQSAELSPTRPACVPQDHLERVLVEHLAELPAARIESGVTVEDVQLDASGARVRVRGTGGSPRSVRARYLIGADGGRGVVRERLGIGQWSTDGLMASFAVLLHAPLWALVGPHRHGLYLVDEPSVGLFLQRANPTAGRTATAAIPAPST